MTFDDIINKKKKEWNCSDLMNTANITHGEKLPFSSPLMNWCTYGGIPRDKITEFLVNLVVEKLPLLLIFAKMQLRYSNKNIWSILSY